MTTDVLSTLGDFFSIEQELTPAHYSHSYLLRDRQTNTKHFLGVLSGNLSSRVEDPQVFLKSLNQYFGLDSAFLEIDQGGSTIEGSLYWLSTSLPPDVAPVQQKVDQQRPLAANQISSIGAACCRALASLHNTGRLHGGLVPASIFTSEHQVHISDTGILAALQVAGIKLGGISPLETRYMSPEQSLTGQGTIQSDIYSLGAVLYQLLTGKPPFGGRTTAAIMASVLFDEAAPGTVSGGQEPGYIASAILRAIEKSPSDRWTSARQFEQALTRNSATATAHNATGDIARARAGCLPRLSGISLISIYALQRILT